MLHDKVPATFLRDLDEGIACHVLHAFMCLVHELEQLVNDGFEELPMCFQEARILSNNVHYVRSDDSLVVLAAFDLAEAKQILDDGHQKTLLGLLVYKTNT